VGSRVIIGNAVQTVIGAVLKARFLTSYVKMVAMFQLTVKPSSKYS
jgi:hypothetical protein